MLRACIVTLSDNYFRADKPQSPILQSDVARPSNIGFTNIIGASQARSALVNVRNRIDDLSAIEGRYGAVQSRLEVAASQLASSGENFAAAASTRRDIFCAILMTFSVLRCVRLGFCPLSLFFGVEGLYRVG